MNWRAQLAWAAKRTPYVSLLEDRHQLLMLDVGNEQIHAKEFFLFVFFFFKCILCSMELHKSPHHNNQPF